MTKKRILIYAICPIALLGALEVLFFWQGAARNIGYMIPNLIFHVPLIAGFVWLAWKGEPKFRLHPFWTPLGMIMIIWPIITFVFADLLDPMKTTSFISILHISETMWYGIAFGLLLGFYSIKSIKTFWYFLLPIAVAWNLQHIGLLLQALGISAFAPGANKGAPTLASYFRAGKFWNDWGWFLSDMIVDVTMAITAAVMIIWGVVNKILKSAVYEKKEYH